MNKSMCFNVEMMHFTSFESMADLRVSREKFTFHIIKFDVPDIPVQYTIFTATGMCTYIFCCFFSAYVMYDQLLMLMNFSKYISFFEGQKINLLLKGVCIHGLYTT